VPTTTHPHPQIHPRESPFGATFIPDISRAHLSRSFAQLGQILIGLVKLAPNHWRTRLKCINCSSALPMSPCSFDISTCRRAVIEGSNQFSATDPFFAHFQSPNNSRRIKYAIVTAVANFLDEAVACSSFDIDHVCACFNINIHSARVRTRVGIMIILACLGIEPEARVAEACGISSARGLAFGTMIPARDKNPQMQVRRASRVG